MNLRTFLDNLPRGGAAEFAAKVGCSTVYLHQIAARQGGREAGVPLAVVIERASNYQVRRWDLRPADWHLCWPELIRDKDAPPIPTEPEAQPA